MQPWLKDSSWLTAFSYIAPRDFYRDTIHRSSSTVADKASQRDTVPASYLLQGISSLNRLAVCIKGNVEMSAMVRQLRDVLRIILERPSGWSEEDQFRLSYPLVMFMTRLPISYAVTSESCACLLITLSHMFAVILSLTVAFPCIDVPTFAPAYVNSILEIGQGLLHTVGDYACRGCQVVHSSAQFMAFPLNAVHLCQIQHSPTSSASTVLGHERNHFEGDVLTQ